MKQLHLLFSTVWKELCVPENWKKSLIVKVPKKGDLTQCDNYIVAYPYSPYQAKSYAGSSLTERSEE